MPDQNILQMSAPVHVTGMASSETNLHPRVLDPPEALLGVRLLIPRSGNEAITLEPPASHEDKEAERRLAKAKAWN